MNYEEEAGKLNQGSATFKPTVGVHKIILMAEPQPDEYIDNETGKITPQIKLKVRIGDEELDWFVGVGKTTQSVYGQLMVLGKAKGKLQGETITLVVNKTKNKNGEERNAYTITESVEAMKEAEKQQEKVQ